MTIDKDAEAAKAGNGDPEPKIILDNSQQAL